MDEQAQPLARDEEEDVSAGHTRDLVPVEVAVDAAFLGKGDGLLTYGMPESWRTHVAPGQLVWVPLRKKLSLGIVTSTRGERPTFTMKLIHSAVDPAVRLGSDRLMTGVWLARQTASSLYSALAPFLPPGVTYRAIEHLRLAPGVDPETADVTPAQRRLLAFLATQDDDVSLDAAKAALKTSLTTVVTKLTERGLIERSARVSRAQPAERMDRFIRLIQPDPAAVGNAPKQRAVLDHLVQRGKVASVGGDGLIRLDEVLARTGTDHAVVNALERKGIIQLVRQPHQAHIVETSSIPTPTLTGAQADAWREIEASLTRRDPTPLVLHGVTGSGKTEVYLRAVAWCLRQGRTAIILVPEIGLATQVVQRVNARFPGQVGVLHSALPESKRFATWTAIAAGEMPIVVGPRSALFAPISELGLIVLDEEHESAYKQDADPRYHARALAEHLAAQHGAVVLLGSATPSVDTIWRTESGEARRLSLPARVGPDAVAADGSRRRVELDLPPVEIVDMRLELHRGNSSLLSGRLQETVEATLAQGQQVILFLNRRGLATVVLCRACGAAVTCPYCDIPLVYHRDRDRLICHRCNHREAAPANCSACGGGLNYFGAGTQRVEDQVKRDFPAARVLRWDQDSVRRNGGHEAMLRRVERREIDIIVGTQMIAKGLDLPFVTAIGVIHADTMLHLPDFRSAERTFQLLTQVAGRAGRRASGSTVVVQTFSPDHYAIQTAARHDYAAFYEEEIDFRRTHRYPPFTRLVRYLFRHPDEAKCAAESDEMARLLARHVRSHAGRADLLGPSPAFASRVRGQYQWQVILRADDLEPLLDNLPARPGWSVDVDPQSML